MKPTCPKCGSINVKVNRAGECLEADCRHVGSAGAFKAASGLRRIPNQRWRDPIASLPGGYDDNA